MKTYTITISIAWGSITIPGIEAISPEIAYHIACEKIASEFKNYGKLEQVEEELPF